MFCVCGSDKNICKIAHNQPTSRYKQAFDGVEELDKNWSFSNHGATKQVSDTVVKVFQIYDWHIKISQEHQKDKPWVSQEV